MFLHLPGFWTVVRTGNFNSFWVCDLNKWKKLRGGCHSQLKLPRQRTPVSRKEGNARGNDNREGRGLTWFPSLYFQPCWRTLLAGDMPRCRCRDLVPATLLHLQPWPSMGLRAEQRAAATSGLMRSSPHSHSKTGRFSTREKEGRELSSFQRIAH